MRSRVKRRARDTFAVIAFGCLVLGCLVSTWALLPSCVFTLAAMLIDPETANERARQYRRQQRAEQMRQQQPDPGVLTVKVRGRVLDCGCVVLPQQTVRCPADAALAEIEQLAGGR